MTERMTIVAGWDDTRAALVLWNRAPTRVIAGWAAVSAGISLTLLVATWALATHAGYNVALHAPESFSERPTLSAAVGIFRHNLLTLALHALICVAGYMATASVPLAAESYTGWARRLHLASVPAALLFVSCAALGSLALQAWTLGHVAPQVAHAYHMPVGELLLLISPHALPELTALFLPLGAWIVLARADRWNELFAASIVTTAIALPLLAMSALVEIYVTPLVVGAMS